MISIISQQIGHTDKDGNTVSKRVMDYLQAAGVSWPADQPPPYWGGALLAWCAIRQGLTPPTNAVDAESWRTWGHPLAGPETGAIAILTGRPSQIGVVQRVSGDTAYIMHPVNGQVQTERINVGRVIECRRPPAGGIPQSMQAGQDVRISLELPQVQQAEQPARLIEHIPASLDEETTRMVRALVQRVEQLERALATHSHEFVRSDGRAIPFDEIVLRSDLARTAA